MNFLLHLYLYKHTLKIKGTSRCHRRTVLSKWFHKEPLTSEEPLFHKRFFVEKGFSDYKKVSKRWFFKEPLTEWFSVEPKMVLLWHRLKKLLKHLLFLKVNSAVIKNFAFHTSTSAVYYCLVHLSALFL